MIATHANAEMSVAVDAVFGARITGPCGRVTGRERMPQGDLRRRRCHRLARMLSYRSAG